MPKTPTILLAEDNPADVFLVREAMRVNNLTVDLHVVEDGEAAIQFIDAADESDQSPLSRTRAAGYQPS